VIVAEGIRACFGVKRGFSHSSAGEITQWRWPNVGPQSRPEHGEIPHIPVLGIYWNVSGNASGMLRITTMCD
jgi:hypothetical protein